MSVEAFKPKLAGPKEEVSYDPSRKFTTQPSCGGVITQDIDVYSYIESNIKRRAKELLTPHIEFFKELGVHRFFLAGGCFYKAEVKDLDIWPVNLHSYLISKEGKEFLEVVNKGVTIQFCQGPVCSSVKELVLKFDFAHCRVGCYVDVTWDDLYITPFVSKEFVAAMAAQTTFYCGTSSQTAHSPIRSLRRLPKVAIKLGLSQEEVMSISNDIVKVIVEKGVEGFKMEVNNV